MTVQGEASSRACEHEYDTAGDLSCPAKVTALFIAVCAHSRAREEEWLVCPMRYHRQGSSLIISFSNRLH